MMGSMAETARTRSLPQTKFSVPAEPTGTVARARLLDALDAGVRGPVTLLAAPAGTGKTALVSAWVAAGRAPGQVAWLSLDRGDADRHGFWRALLQALTGAGAGERLGSLTSPGTRGESVVAALDDAFPDPEERFILVLDDFQEVGDDVQEDIERMLRFPPAGLALVILSRADPAIGVGRLRLNGALTELRAEDLAFTREEAARLLEGLGVQLAPEDVTTLWQRTEGWAAGLRLAALTLHAHPHPARFVEQFAGTDATVSDYLISEVLARQPPDVREFLLRTSIADVLTADLAVALTGDSDARRALTRLEHSGVLLSPLDETGTWLRYHPLFAELLRAELQAELPGEVDGLHRRAAEWFAGQGDLLAALRHAAAGGAWDLAAALTSEHWVQLLIRGEMEALRPVVDGMPRQRVRDCPELALAFGGALLDGGDDVGAELYLRHAEQGSDLVPAERRAAFTVAMAAVRLYIGRIRGEPQAALAGARALLEPEPLLEGGGVTADLRSLALGNLGIVELWTGDLGAAADHLERAHAAAGEADGEWLALTASAHLAVLAMFRSEFARATRRSQEALDIAERRGWTATGPAGAAFGVASGLAMQRGDRRQSEAFLARADDALRDSRDRPLRAVHAFNRAVSLADRGRAAEALDVLRAGREALGSWPLLATMEQMMTALEALLWGAMGEREAAAEIIASAPEQRSLPIATAAARLALGDGDPAAAHAALAPVLADGKGEMVYFRADAWMLDARALSALARHDEADRSLERALDLADPAGLDRLVVSQGSTIRPLLQRHMSTGTAHGPFLSEALARIGHGGPGGRAPPMVLPEPPSEREQAILRYLPTMMSNQEIAGELGVSVNTVKTHLKGLYRKLDATSRRGAVQRGRELGLLP